MRKPARPVRVRREHKPWLRAQAEDQSATADPERALVQRLVERSPEAGSASAKHPSSAEVAVLAEPHWIEASRTRGDRPHLPPLNARHTIYK